MCIRDSTKTRKREVVQVLQVAMYLAKKHTDSSSSKIGQLIGNKDHATVLHCLLYTSFMKDYYDYYKTERGYHPRSINSGLGWNKTSNLAFQMCIRDRHFTCNAHK